VKQYSVTTSELARTTNLVLNSRKGESVFNIFLNTKKVEYQYFKIKFPLGVF
jgi:hypothetical protein